MLPNKRLPFWTSILFTSAVLSCAGLTTYAEAPPKWIHGEPPAQYGRNLFVSAVGSGKSLEEAKGNAKRGLAEVFDAQISGQYAGQSQSNQAVHTSGKVEGKDESQSQTQVLIKTEVQLSSVEIVESYFNPESKEYFALAILDKLKLKNKLNLDGAQLRARMMEFKDRFEKEKKGSEGQKALALLPEYEKLNQSYGVISGGGRLPPLLTVAEEEALRRELKTLALSRRLWIEWTHEAGSESDLKGALNEVLAARGLAIESHDQAQAKALLKLSLTQRPAHLKVEGWVKMEYVLKGDLSAEGKSIGTFSLAKEGVGRTVEQCLKKVQEELLAEFANKVVKSLEDQ